MDYFIPFARTIIRAMWIRPCIIQGENKLGRKWIDWEFVYWIWSIYQNDLLKRLLSRRKINIWLFPKQMMVLKINLLWNKKSNYPLSNHKSLIFRFNLNESGRSIVRSALLDDTRYDSNRMNHTVWIIDFITLENLRLLR